MSEDPRMRILILGGTQFLGRHLVDAARASDHEVVLFNRGQTNPDLYPEVEKLRGDRDGDLGALEGRAFDAVIDPAGYVPRLVEQSARLLEPNVGRYAFVSSISVYADFTRPGLDEDSPLAELEDPSTEEVMENYGALKVACERVVGDVFGSRALNLRPGLIVGPHDPTNRFTYWVMRVARGGRVLAPGPPERTIQYIDARDLAEWTIRCLEKDSSGAYNATGPVPPVSFGDLLESCRHVSGAEAEFAWADDEFLTGHEVGPWIELPLWIPTSDEHHALMSVDVSNAVANGLTFRSVEDTVRATLEWARTLEEVPGDAGLEAAKESELLTKL